MIEKPNVFISYCWTSDAHKDQIREWAERLTADGIDVVLDQWSFAEGQDKFHFMERMVRDEDITNVLLMSDAMYARKANERGATGVGTETQIISAEIYNSVDQTRFIPILCERGADGDECLPTFMKSRKYIDFSTPERAEENWETLVRCCFGKPAVVKPPVGKAPAYITNDSPDAPTGVVARLSTLRNGLIRGDRRTPRYRKDFSQAWVSFVDQTRRRDSLNAYADDPILSTLSQLAPVRECITEWLDVELLHTDHSDLHEPIEEALEHLLRLKDLPEDVSTYTAVQFDAHAIFALDTFLCIVATLVDAKADQLLADILSADLMLPRHRMGRSESRYGSYSDLYAASQRLLRAMGKEFVPGVNGVGFWLKESAQDRRIGFSQLAEADLLVWCHSVLTDGRRWYPIATPWLDGAELPFFVKAERSRGFNRLKTILGVSTGDDFRERIIPHLPDMRGLWFGRQGIVSALNAERLDTRR